MMIPGQVPFTDTSIDKFVPNDYDTLAKWHRFSLEIHGPDYPSTGHLEELIERFGKSYRVEFTAEDFFKYLNTINAAYLSDEEHWNHYANIT